MALGSYIQQKVEETVRERAYVWLGQVSRTQCWEMRCLGSDPVLALICCVTLGRSALSSGSQFSYI